MFDICVFAGTTEGRLLLEFLAGQPVQVMACTATDYGEKLVAEADNIVVSAKRLDAGEIEELIKCHQFSLVIDATHPFAADASENIRQACAKCSVEYLRLNRKEVNLPDGVIFVDSIQEAASFLSSHPGNALITTGSKALEAYTAIEDYRERLFVRVLPMISSLDACTSLGFSPSHIIAMQGPFSVDMNMAMLRAVRAKWLVTKDSGGYGGYPEKLRAAHCTGAGCIVVGRPLQPPGSHFSEVVDRLIEQYDLKDIRQIDIIGIGMGTRETLSIEADEALDSCDCIIGAPRLLEAVSRQGIAEHAEISPQRIVDWIESHREYRRVAVVVSGDCGFYSGAKKLIPLLTRHHVRVLPGLSSLQVLCARLKTHWDDIFVLSLHGRRGSLIPHVKSHSRVFALLDGSDAVRRVCRELCESGLGNAHVWVGQRLGYSDESIESGTAAELRDMECDPLSVVLIERDRTGAALTFGLPDNCFARIMGESGKTIPMTKSEVRAVTLSKLQLGEEAVVWDVGAGTGSVTVEAASLCQRGKVYAIDCREDAVELIKKNLDRFGLDNVSVILGKAPEALADLPAPTHVFVGGSSGSLKDIMDLALEKNPHVRIVINAVSLESVSEIAALIHALGFNDCEVVQLNVSKSHTAGGHSLMKAMNPVWIASLQNRAGE
ncbi:MAG: precorrin-6A reductase [Clostridia bacterium]|nr:precorrin-6A reductase [Clostridia bacterium]